MVREGNRYDISGSFPFLPLPDLLTGGGVSGATNVTVEAQGNIVLTDSDPSSNNSHTIAHYLGQVRGNEKTEPGLAFYPPEQQILAVHDEAIALDLELTQLRSIVRSDRTPTQQLRLDDLVTIEQDLLTTFFDFVDSPEIIDLVN